MTVKSWLAGPRMSDDASSTTVRDGPAEANEAGADGQMARRKSSGPMSSNAWLRR